LRALESLYIRALLTVDLMESSLKSNKNAVEDDEEWEDSLNGADCAADDESEDSPEHKP
jgi:hypothetical protein